MVDAADANVDAADPMRACWRRAERCSWATPGFTFQEIGSNLGDVSGTRPTFSPDGCTVMYSDAAGDLYERRRPASMMPFGEPSEMRGLNDQGGRSASVTPNGLEVLFKSDSDEIFRSTRDIPVASWGPPARANDLLTPGVATTHFDPILAPDGLTVYFAPVLDGPGDTDCAMQFGSLPGYQLCAESATECEMALETHGTCAETCAAAGRTCVTGYDEDTSACERLAEVGCDTTFITQICVCALGTLDRVLFAADRSVPGVAFNPPRPLGLELPADVTTGAYTPSTTHDNLVLVFGTIGSRRDLMYSTRSEPGGSWSAARLVPTDLLTTITLFDAAVSPDGCELAVRAGGRTAHLVYVDPL